MIAPRPIYVSMLADHEQASKNAKVCGLVNRWVVQLEAGGVPVRATSMRERQPLQPEAVLIAIVAHELREAGGGDLCSKAP